MKKKTLEKATLIAKNEMWNIMCKQPILKIIHRNLVRMALEPPQPSHPFEEVNHPNLTPYGREASAEGCNARAAHPMFGKSENRKPNRRPTENWQIRTVSLSRSEKFDVKKLLAHDLQPPRIVR